MTSPVLVQLETVNVLNTQQHIDVSAWGRWGLGKCCCREGVPVVGGYTAYLVVYMNVFCSCHQNIIAEVFGDLEIVLEWRTGGSHRHKSNGDIVGLIVF